LEQADLLTLGVGVGLKVRELSHPQFEQFLHLSDSDRGLECAHLQDIGSEGGGGGGWDEPPAFAGCGLAFPLGRGLVLLAGPPEQIIGTHLLHVEIFDCIGVGFPGSRASGVAAGGTLQSPVAPP
jgi:hypothetical protein